MKDDVLIAHLSDLHCNGHDEWENNFYYVLNLLNDIQPHIILITGDLVDNPMKKNFEMLKRVFSENIKSKLPESYVVPVPGNHDYFYLGNKIFNIFKSNNFEKYKNLIVYPEYGIDYVIDEIFEKFNIALFPLDSNRCKWKLGFARGEIFAPLKILEKIEKRYKEKDKELYLRCKKIIMMHHHPLPLPTSQIHENRERFLILRNAYKFLEAVSSKNIDIILHGHKHIGAIVKYDFYNYRNSPIVISACGSTSKLTESTREIKTITIKQRGSMIIRSYRAYNDQSKFHLIPEITKEVVYYGDIRKKKYGNTRPITTEELCPIENVLYKTKIIDIEEDGSASIEIMYSGIRWKKDILPEQKIIRETLRADLGRIWGGLYEFGNISLNRTTPYYQQEFRHPNIINKSVSPVEPEKYDYSFRPKHPGLEREEDLFVLSYLLFNGFTMNIRQHKEAYPNWPSNLPLQEIASVSVNYPTYTLELIIKFPPNYFPKNDNDFFLRCYKKVDQENALDLLYERNPIEIDYDETRFLERKGVLRIRRRLHMVSLIIKYPCPDLIYAIRWNILGNDNLKLLPEHHRKFSDLINIFCKNENNKNLDNFYSQSVSIIKKILGDNVEIFLIGYSADEKKLIVMRTPDKFKSSVGRKFLVGRGPAGKAFKMREVQFWERDADTLLEVENVIDNLKPLKVLAVPLLYPRLMNSDWENYKKYFHNNSTKVRCPALGVLSIVSENETTLKQFSFEDDRKRKVSQLYKELEKIFVEVFNNI